MALQSSTAPSVRNMMKQSIPMNSTDPMWDGECRTCLFAAEGEQVWSGFDQRGDNAGRHAEHRHQRRCSHSEKGADATSPDDATDAEQTVEP